MENVHICLLIKCLQVFTVNPSDTVAEERQRGGGLRTHTHTQANVWFHSNNSLGKIVDGGKKVIDRVEGGGKKIQICILSSAYNSKWSGLLEWFLGEQLTCF